MFPYTLCWFLLLIYTQDISLRFASILSTNTDLSIYLYDIYICVCAHIDMDVYMCIPTNDFSSSLLPQGLLSLFHFSIFVSHCLHICKHYLHICNSVFVNHFYNEKPASYCPQNIYLIKPLWVYKVLSALHSLPGMDTLLTDSTWASVFNDELMFCKSTFLDIWPLN